MSGISKKSLFEKLNELAYKTIEKSHEFCLLRGNPYIELSHWVDRILLQQDSDFFRIIKYYKLDEIKLSKDILEAINRLKTNSSSTGISSQLEHTVQQAWLYSSLEFSNAEIRTGHLLIGMLDTQVLRDSLFAISKEFRQIQIDDLLDNYSLICANSPENIQTAIHTQPADVKGTNGVVQQSHKTTLENYSSNLTEKAKNGEIDPIVGRDNETRQIVDILMRRRQNNPILIGEAGVGKTAIVEGFALRIANGEVPPSFSDVSLYSLDLAALQAGASMKGEFEERLKKIVKEVQASETPIILFIDEAHTLIGAGGSAGTGDAANILKPELARGTLRTIAATTWNEYKKHIEKDPALTRRFQVIQVEEPNEEKGIQMMRCLVPVMEKHHKILILDEALEASVKLSHRYIPARQLPDKSISVLDTACARVAVSQHTTPSLLEDVQKNLELCQSERSIIQRESKLGLNTRDRLLDIETKIQALNAEFSTLNLRWGKEKEYVDKIISTRKKLQKDTQDSSVDQANRDSLLIELHELQNQLVATQGDTPLVLPTVNKQAVASVISDWTGIPIGRMVKDELAAVLKLSETLGKRVVGQQHSLDLLAQRIRTSRAGLESPDKPIGVFLLCGPSGVGKTETALALAEALYSDEASLITINMSEFQEAHTVSTLKGSPPGYVGYGEGGILTEAVRRRPYSIVLLDEIEKAHSDVHEIFFQVFDKGWMDDAEGRYIDFRNTIILLTSNAGADVIHQLCNNIAVNDLPSPKEIIKAIRKPLRDIFPAALLGRLDVIPYYPLGSDLLKHIIQLKLNKIESRVEETYKIDFSYDDDAINTIGERCMEIESGARVIDGIISNNLLPTIGQKLLERTLSSEQYYSSLHISVENGKFKYNFTPSKS